MEDVLSCPLSQANGDQQRTSVLREVLKNEEEVHTLAHALTVPITTLPSHPISQPQGLFSTCIASSSIVPFSSPNWFRQVWITHTYIRTYIHTYMHTYICTYIHTYVHIIRTTYISIRTYINTIHMYLRTYTYHTRAHTPLLLPLPSLPFTTVLPWLLTRFTHSTRELGTAQLTSFLLSLWSPCTGFALYTSFSRGFST